MREQVLVADQAGLARAAEAVSAEPRAALDTESNGFHAYSEQVCLVQIATPQADFAVDALDLFRSCEGLRRWRCGDADGCQQAHHEGKAKCGFHRGPSPQNSCQIECDCNQ